MVSNTYGQPEVVGGITSTEEVSALTIGPTATPRTGCSNDAVNGLEDNGAPGHHLDDAIIPGFRDRLEEYMMLDVPQETRQHEDGARPTSGRLLFRSGRML